MSEEMTVEDRIAAVNAKKPPQKEVMRFRLLAGAHQQGRNDDGTPRLFKPGQIIESTVDLTQCNSKNPAATRKFERVFSDGSTDSAGRLPPNPFAKDKRESAAEYSARMAAMAKKFQEHAELASKQHEDLELLTVADLRKYAADNEIDLGDAVDKDEILALIRRA